MLGILIIVFVAAFLIAMLLLLVASRSKESQQEKRIVSRLDSLITGASGAPEQVSDLRKHERLSSIPWLNRLLARIDIFPRVHLLLYQADLKWTVGTLLLGSLACFAGAAYAAYWRTGAIGLAIIAGLLAGVVPIGFVFYRRSHRFEAFERILPEALDLIVAALRAGHSLTAAMGMVGKEMAQPIAGEFRKCFDEQMFGSDTRTAMLNLVARVPIQPMRIIVTAVLVQKDSGGNLAEVLDKAAYVIRERFRLQRQVKVHTAQGRMTGWILALLPVVLGFGLYLTNPENFSILWKRPVGIKMLYAAVIMTLIGGLIIRKIVRIRV